MKRSIAFIFMLGSCLTLCTSAQTAPAAAPAGATKVAVISFQMAVAQTNEGQRSFADLQKKYAPKEAELKALSEEVDTLTKQLQTQGDKLSDAERASRAKTIDEKKKKLDRSVEDSRNDFQQEMQEAYNGVATKVYDVLSAYAQQQGYTLVLDISQQQTPVLYATEATNITKAIVDAYNVKSGVPPPPVPPASATRPPSGAQPGAAKPAGTTPAAR